VNTYTSAQLDALGDPTRRAILSQLRKGPLPVGALAQAFPLSRPAISRHLKILKAARLVTDRAEGTRRLYQLDPAGFQSVRAYPHQFWTTALHAFKDKADAEPTRTHR
jgi:DNA-binding transcriptional ArsR family regulator